MAKYYLNAQEREFFIWAVNLAGYIGDKAAEFEKVGKPKEYVKWLRTARSFIMKTTEAMAAPLEAHSKEQIERQMKMYKPLLVHTKEFRQKAREMMQAARKIEEEVLKEFPRENLYDLAEYVLDDQCKKCDGHKPNCHLQKIFRKMEIPPFDESEERCEFKIST